MPERYERLLFRIALAVLAVVIVFVIFREISGDDGSVTNLSTADPTESEAKNIAAGEEENAPVALALTSPAAGTSVIGPEVTVEGTAPVGTPVIITDETSGNQLAIKRVSEDGTFIADLVLTPGFHDLVLSSRGALEDGSARIEVLAAETTTTEGPPETIIDFPLPPIEPEPTTTTTRPRTTTPTTRFVPSPTTTAPPVFFPQPTTTAAPTTTRPPDVVLPPPPPATTPTTAKPTTTTAKPTTTTAKPTTTTAKPTTTTSTPGPTTSIVETPAA